jgi:DNA-binding NarL/FixJ family response regulator
MKRVLMGDFGALVRAGFEDMLRERDVELIAAEDADLVERLVTTLPDVVILDLDVDNSDELVQRITTEFPALKVVACSSRHPTMRVYPPFHHGESYDSPLDPDVLTAALKA